MTTELKRIKLLRLSSRESPDLLATKLDTLTEWFPGLEFQDIPPDPEWPYTAGSAVHRAQTLNQTLSDPRFGTIWCARGGYGASDLLAHLDFSKLKQNAPCLIVGFSDVSALHSAFYAQLRWPGLHAPMPATTLWGESGEDVRQLRAILDGDCHGMVPLSEPVKEPVSGRLFGGCFSVLTNLIGTPYFPKSLTGHIVFLEDTGESPGRLMRYFNQWVYAGILDDVQGIVLGNFRDCGDPELFKHHIQRQIADRTNIPVLAQGQFGHCAPNYPLMIGAQARIDGRHLRWQLDKGDQRWS